ncbi:hypothetical protein [Marinobacterium marinum]|uniref:Uncharacterized protein n=1 Tax=Marinobacterium marinum TaxID=2756129 RepID=A0A7W1WZN0_9GAMM|nr:hypothetical protein [Marinobacterium marinum]MBA4503074.1 hypothetical protein [Marinobacterium marinum]
MPASLFDHRYGGLIYILALIVLVLMPILASAAPVMVATKAEGLTQEHAHEQANSQADEHLCSQQCLSNCAGHCAPVPAAVPALATTEHLPPATVPDLYHPPFPSGLHRPPKT